MCAFPGTASLSSPHDPSAVLFYQRRCHLPSLCQKCPHSQLGAGITSPSPWSKAWGHFWAVPHSWPGELHWFPCQRSFFSSAFPYASKEMQGGGIMNEPAWMGLEAIKQLPLYLVFFWIATKVTFSLKWRKVLGLHLLVLFSTSAICGSILSH